MGGTSTATASMEYEAKFRAASMFSVFRKTKKNIFNNPRVDKEARLQYTDSLLFSRLLFDSAVWEHLEVAAVNTIRNAYMAPLRASTDTVTTKDSVTRFTNLQVLVAADALPFDFRIKVSRLRYMPSLLKHASPLHLRLVFHQLPNRTSWASMVLADFSWMWQNIQTLFETFPDPSSDLSFWLNFIRCNSVGWYRFVNMSKRIMLKVTRSEQAAEVPIPILDGPGDHGDYECIECSQHFHSHCELLSHRRHKHAYNNPFRVLVSSSVCASCKKDFHTIHRAFIHVAYASNVCSKWYSDFVLPMTDAQLAHCTAAYKAEKRRGCKELLKPPIITLE